MFPPNEGTRPPDNPRNQSPRGPRNRRSYYINPSRGFHDHPYSGFNEQHVYPQNQYLNVYSGHDYPAMIGFSQQPPPVYQQYYSTYDATPNGNFGPAQEMNPGQANTLVASLLVPTAVPYVPLSERQHWQQPQGYDSPVASSGSPYRSPAPAYGSPEYGSPAFGSPQRYVQANSQIQTPKRSTLRATAPPFYPAHMRQNAASPLQVEIEETPIIQQSARAKIYEQMPVPENMGPTRKKRSRGGGFVNNNQRPEVVIRECNGQSSSTPSLVADARHQAVIPPQRSNPPRRRTLAECPVQSLTRPSVGQWKELEEDMPAQQGAERRGANSRHFMEDGPEYDESPLRPRQRDSVSKFEIARTNEEAYGRYNHHHGSPAPER
ncbi:hypothetical protein N7494_001575 [Penicillium frequentans]|uniref:Uncharacterized protein n=1 Tax=Penicillium frequentans TaxID=3151616 RepID=A0AAD6D201_9EURO|nr:hypothetical protein N7494_001575 [Penicillium glabrum]